MQQDFPAKTAVVIVKASSPIVREEYHWTVDIKTPLSRGSFPSSVQVCWAFTSSQVWESWIGPSGVDLITIWLVPCTDASCIRTKPTLFSPFPTFSPTPHYRTFTFKLLFIASFSLFWLISFADHMSPIRKPLPSFTLVITSSHHSLLPTARQFDSYVSPTMLPTAPDYLMVLNTYDPAYCMFWLTLHYFVSENHWSTRLSEGCIGVCLWWGCRRTDHFWSRKSCHLWSWGRAN